MKVPEHLVLTGRIDSYLKNPQGRLPVSCTVFVVANKLYGRDGIIDSWEYTSYGLRHAAGVAVHLSEVQIDKLQAAEGLKWYVYLNPEHPNAGRLARDAYNQIEEIPADANYVLRVADSMEEESPGQIPIQKSWGEFVAMAYAAVAANEPLYIDLSALRPAMTRNDLGLVASGPASFYVIYQAVADFVQKPTMLGLMTVYSRINEILRRGGTYKNGAVNLHLDADHPDVLEFALASRKDTAWARLTLNVDETFIDHPNLEQILPKIASGDLFLVKKLIYNGVRIYHNVCLEINIISRATCLLAHINAGSCLPKDLVEVYKASMKWLCEFHARTGVGKDNQYLPPELDKQVGLGVIGLANMLAIEQISYKTFAKSLRSHAEQYGKLPENLPYTVVTTEQQRSDCLAYYFVKAFEGAAEVAKSYGMQRAFTIAPTATTSFKAVDRLGYTTTPEISPPLDRQVTRLSETMDEVDVDYHPDCEIASEVGWDTYFELMDAWQLLMDATGLGHTISSNWWSDVIAMDKSFIQRWLDSHWKSLYYAMPVRVGTQDKSEVISCGLDKTECSSCAE